MADTTQIKWVYPPDFDGFIPDGKCGFKRVIVKITSSSDGTGESDAIKVRRSDLKTPNGVVPTKLVVEKIQGIVHGGVVVLEWDNSTDEVIARLNAGTTSSSLPVDLDWWRAGGLAPVDADGTGNIVLTSTMDSGDTYDLTLTIRLKE
jgi:hypothetical protein